MDRIAESVRISQSDGSVSKTGEVLAPMPMSDDNAQRLKRLAERAKKLDEAIQRAAQMNKQIVDEIRRLGERDRLKAHRATRTPRARANEKKGSNGGRARRGR